MADDNWYDSFSEEVKDSSEIKNFKSAEDLAKSYIESNKLLSQRYEGIGKEDNYDEFAKKAEKFFKLPKSIEEYKATEEETFDKLGHKLKLHPEFQLKPLKKELEEHYKKTGETETQKKVEFWREKSTEITKEVENKDEIIGKAFGKLGTTREKFEESMGDIQHHPQITKMLLQIGKQESKTSEPITTTAGGTTENQDSMQEKFQYVRKYLDNYESPYYNRKEASHGEIKSKTDRYIKELTQYEQKKNIRFLSQNQ